MSAARNILDTFSILFWIKFWSLCLETFYRCQIFCNPTSSYVTPYGATTQLKLGLVFAISTLRKVKTKTWHTGSNYVDHWQPCLELAKCSDVVWGGRKMSKENIHIKNMGLYYTGVFKGVTISIGCICLLFSHQIHCWE